MEPTRPSSARRSASMASHRRSSASCRRDVGFPDRSEIWLPLAAAARRRNGRRAATRFLDGFGRLRRGVTIEQATTELTGITASLAERYPDTNRNTAPFVDAIWHRRSVRRGDVRAARRRRLRAAHRVRQRRKSAAGALGRSLARRHASAGPGREPLAHRASTAGGRPAARDGRAASADSRSRSPVFRCSGIFPPNPRRRRGCSSRWT